LEKQVKGRSQGTSLGAPKQVGWLASICPEQAESSA
jgi:hypothetical protein